MADTSVAEPAPAKINPFLRVLGRRPDGFHEVETLVLPITLADGVQATAAEDVTLAVAGERANEVPRGEENLVMLAARALAESSGVNAGARLLLSKRIPVAAGLGGGSADAAATLRALDRLWRLGWELDRLAEVGATVGSDVPALVHGLSVIARGRGERVEPFAVTRTWWVLVAPPFRVAAAEAYGWWDADGGNVGPDPRPLLDALVAGDVEKTGALLHNDLQAGVAARRPGVAEALARLERSGAAGTLMSGSGPAVAGLARDAQDAERLAVAVDGIIVSAITRPVA